MMRKGVTITAKLACAAIVGSLVFMCIIGVVVRAFSNVGALVPDIVDTNILYIVENAKISRALAAVFEQMIQDSHGYQVNQEELSAQRDMVREDIEEAIETTSNAELKEVLSELSQHLAVFFSQLSRALSSYEQQSDAAKIVLQDLQSLDVLLSQRIVEIVMAEGDPDYLSDQLTRIPSYRESIHYAEHLFLEITTEYDAAVRKQLIVDLFDVVNEFILAIETMTPSDHNVSALNKVLLVHAKEYRKKLYQSVSVMRHLDFVGLDVERLKGAVSAIQKQIDGENLRVARRGKDHVAQILRAATRDIVVLACILMVLLYGGIFLFLRRNIHTPMQSLLKVVNAMQSGDFSQQLSLKRSDEWQQIEDAINEMGIARKAAEHLLAEREENIRITLNSIGDAVIATNVEGTIIRMNPVGARLTGWSVKEAVGKPLTEVFVIVQPKNAAPLENPVSKVMRTGDIVSLANDTVLRSRDGNEYQIADSAAPIRNDTGDLCGVVLVFRDVSETYRVEKKFRQAQKLDAIGKLAGGVAHDFNNMLLGILGFGEALLLRAKEDPVATRYAQRIIDTALRATDLTKRLLAFSRQGNLVRRSFDIHEVIEAVSEILERSIDKRILVTLGCNAEKSFIKGDPAQIEAALLNIALNARDAMPDGGALLFRTRNLTITGAVVGGFESPLPDGEYIEVEISDTGFGMTKEIQEHIFDPFFTTKDVGAGTGLGLSAVHGTVVEHRGRINVYSEPGQGTVIKICLPLSESVAVDSVSSEVSDPAHGEGCVLIIEDEEVVMEMVEMILTDNGYTVLTAATIADALDLFAQHQERIDVVIMDIVMPEMSGADLFYRLKEIKDDVKVIASSGYPKNASIEQLLADGVCDFIQKPYKHNDLLKKIVAVIT